TDGQDDHDRWLDADDRSQAHRRCRPSKWAARGERHLRRRHGDDDGLPRYLGRHPGTARDAQSGSLHGAARLSAVAANRRNRGWRYALAGPPASPRSADGIGGQLQPRLSAGDSLFVYAGYPGEPALGPSAFMHRISAIDDPEAPISHHWLDSTHITYGVATLGWVHDGWKVEASQFTGREPDQHRFNFDPARFDSTSLRVSFNPDPHWSLQVSGGWLKSPEQLTPAVNEQRFTASATYYTPLAGSASLAATLAFGNKHLSNGMSESAGLIEAEYKPARAWTLFARGESLGSDELVPGGRVNTARKLGFGLIHDWDVADHLTLGLGALYDFDFAPPSPTASYGSDPHGTMVFARLL